MTEPERRRAPRVAKRVMLKFRCLAPDLLRDKGDQVGLITEVSRGGLILRTQRTYLPGAILELQMPETTLGPARKLTLRVVWQRRTENSTQFDVGGQFVRLPSTPAPAAPPEAKRVEGETRRYERSTLGVSTGDTIRRVKATVAPAGQERRKHARWSEKIYLKYR